MNDIHVGLIGFGFAGRTFHAPLLQSTPGLRLCAVASSQPALVERHLGSTCQVHAAPQDLIERHDLDLVVIATPNHTHAPLARAALQAGKAVVVDKPFALDTAEAESLVTLAEARGLLLSVFHNRRWDSDYLTLKALLASGRLGRMVALHSHFDRYRPLVRPRWRESAQPGGGLWSDLAPHLLDQALQLFGPPLALSADIATQRDGAEADDHFHATLRYASGLRVHCSASTLAALPAPRFVALGTHGAWRKWPLDAQEDALRAGLAPDPAQPDGWGQDPAAGELSQASTTDPMLTQTLSSWPTQAGRYPDYYCEVVAALRGSGPNPVPARQALAVMRLLDLGRASHAQRRELPCPAELGIDLR